MGDGNTSVWTCGLKLSRYECKSAKIKRSFIQGNLKGLRPFKLYASPSPLTYRVSKRGFAPLFNILPLCFEGEGDKGGEVDK